MIDKMRRFDSYSSNKNRHGEIRSDVWVSYLGACLQGINEILRKADGGFAEEVRLKSMARERTAYLEKTCCVLEGVAFEDPWPML